MHYKYHEDDSEYHNHTDMNKFYLDFSICITCKHFNDTNCTSEICTKVIESFKEEPHVLRKTSTQHTH